MNKYALVKGRRYRLVKSVKYIGCLECVFSRLVGGGNVRCGLEGCCEACPGYIYKRVGSELGLE